MKIKPMIIALMMFGYSDVGWSVFYGFIMIAYYYCVIGLLRSAPLFVLGSDDLGLRVPSGSTKARQGGFDLA